MSITEFLLARIMEDKERALADIDAEVDTLRHDGMPDTTREDLLTMKSNYWRRPLAECEAKRRIVEMHPVYADSGQHDCPGEWPNYAGPGDPCPTLLSLASVYADHPDYNPAWTMTV